MEWITNNFPIVSGIVVALLSSISAFINSVNERNIEMRDIRKAKEYTDMYVTLPDDSKARENINLLLVSLTEKNG